MEIRASELKQKLNSNEAVLIDVRTGAEFETVHVKGAVHIPLDQLDKQKAESLCQNAKQIFTICHSGKRGQAASEKLQQLGFANALNVAGGTLACLQEGLEVVKGSTKIISLERQVRIAAGALVLIGAILALTFNYNWILLSGFVGAGLIFAGITDTCGMAMLLAKMPWNSGSNKKCNL